MTATSPRQRAPWWLGGVLLSQVLLMSWTARYPDSDQSLLRTWVLSGFSVAARVVNWGVSKVSGAVSGYVTLKGAREENTQLKEQVRKLASERDRFRELAAQDASMRAEYGVPGQPQYREIAATVLTRDPSLWFRRILIDRGSNDGVKNDMPVAAATGIVGRVVAVGPNCAVVQVITDRQAGVGAMIQSTREMGEVRGLDDARCELKNIKATSSVKPGDVIVTSGLDGIYPKGLTVGEIESVQDDPSAPWHKLVVRPSAPVDHLEYVQVLLVEPKDLRAPDTIK